jgi:hypothetical protein
MTSLRQIEANRRNVLKGTGPRTEGGKKRSRRNAIRHGLTAESVIGVLEDPKDYRAFERSVTAGTPRVIRCVYATSAAASTAVPLACCYR